MPCRASSAIAEAGWPSINRATSSACRPSTLINRTCSVCGPAAQALEAAAKVDASSKLMADFLSFMVAPLCSQGEHHPGSFVFQHRDQGSTCWIIRSVKIALVVIATVLQVLSFCTAYAHGDHKPRHGGIMGRGNDEISVELVMEKRTVILYIED